MNKFFLNILKSFMLEYTKNEVKEEIVNVSWKKTYLLSLPGLNHRPISSRSLILQVVENFHANIHTVHLVLLLLKPHFLYHGHGFTFWMV